MLVSPALAAAPTASNTSASVAEDSSVNITLRATDPEGQSMTYSVVGNPSRGTVSIAGSVATYRPSANVNGSDSFTFRARDSGGSTSNTATVSVTIRAVNDAPTAGSASVEVSEDRSSTFTLPGSDVDSTSLTWSITSAPTQGTVSVTPSTGAVVYTPPANFTGMTSFRYQVSDGARAAGGTITVTVVNGDDPPTASAQTVAATEDGGNVSMTLVGNDPDGDTLTYTLATMPTHGTLGLNGRVAVYAPDADFYGTDTFTFTVTDGRNVSAPATVTVNVAGVNDAPEAWATSGMTDGRVIQLATYTADRDSTVGTPTLATRPTSGSATVVGSRIRYTPAAGFVGMDRFTYQVSDGSLTTTAEVRVSVLGSYGAPRSNWSQVGANSIPFYADATSTPDTASAAFQGTYILEDFYDLGLESYRQLRAGDVTWESFEPNNGSIVDDDTTELVTIDEIEPRVTVFDTMYASPTPPWATTSAEFQKSMNTRAYAYLDDVLDRYADDIRYWEVGNEMFHWVAMDDPPADPTSIPDMPASYPLDGYSPEQQAEFLSDASRYIQSRDPDAIIVLSSVLANSDATNEWLERVITHTGTDWFDVVTWHSYEPWNVQRGNRLAFDEDLVAMGLGDKLVQLTETGTSAYDFQTAKTDYPNSESTQAADVFRLLLPAFAAGDSAVIWHTYREFSPDDTGTFGGLGLFDYDTTPRPAAFSMMLLTSELMPMVQATDLSDGGVYQYEVRTQGGATRQVLWGSGTVDTPAGFTEVTSVVPDASGAFTWTAVGATLTLGSTPVLLR